VWLQAPGYVTRMFSRDYLPLSVQCQVTAPQETLDASAERSADSQTLVLHTVNPTDMVINAQIHLAGFTPRKPVARVAELSGPLESRNTVGQPDAIVPRQREWQHGLKDGGTAYTFPPHSVNVLRFE
jgi:alpha-L-arabinofuranosidase